jgi:hypothetical protein
MLEEKLYRTDEELSLNTIPVHVDHLCRLRQVAGANPAIHTILGELRSLQPRLHA